MTENEFKATFRDCMIELRDAVEGFDWANPEHYGLWLRQSLEYATCSTRILALTGGMLPRELTALSNRFIAHAAEEKGHDRLLEHDISKLGFQLSELPLLAEAEAFHKSLYYWLFTGQPIVILGWVFALEGIAVAGGKKVHQRVLAAHGSSAASFLKVHAEEDEDHLVKAFEVLNALPPAQIDQIEHGVRLYTQLYKNILSAISRSPPPLLTSADTGMAL